MQDAVVDTNILIRALLTPDSSDGQIFIKIKNLEINLYTSNNQLDELIRVLEYPRLKKLGIDQRTKSAFFKTIVSLGKFITPREVNLCRDKFDNMILGIAMTMADKNKVYLISADKDLLVLKGRVEGVAIMTPQEFLRLKR